MVSPGNEVPHIYSRVISSKTRNTEIYKIQGCQSNTSSSRQHCGFKMFDENRGYTRSENGGASQGNLGVPLELWDYNYCRISPKRVECSSRLGISNQFGLLRLNAESSNFLESLPNKGCSRERIVCIPSITSDTNLCCIESRFSQSCYRCISTGLGTQIPVRFSSILRDSKNSQQNTLGNNSKENINNPSLENTHLVYKNFEHVNQESYFAALDKRPSEKFNLSFTSEQDSGWFPG